MTASSSDNDLADLLGDLANGENEMDEEMLAAIDGPAIDIHANGTDHSDGEPVAQNTDSADSSTTEEEVFVAEIVEDEVVDNTATEADLQEGADALAAAADGDTTPDESEEMTQFAAATNKPARDARGATAGKTKGKRGRMAKAATGDAMKSTMAPILLTVGIVVMLPAIWGTLLLSGVDTFMSERGNAQTMAKFMLVCWPMSIALIVTAIILFMQLSKAKQKAATREEQR